MSLYLQQIYSKNSSMGCNSTRLGRGSPTRLEWRSRFTVLRANVAIVRSSHMWVRPLIESHGSPGRVPAAQGHQRPNGFDQAERPGALKKPVKRTETTRAGESQDEPRAALLEGVADQHRRHRKQAESCKAVHLSTHTSAAFGISRRPLARVRRPDARRTRGSMILRPRNFRTCVGFNELSSRAPSPRAGSR